MHSVATGRVLFEIGGVPIRKEVAQEGEFVFSGCVVQALNTWTIQPSGRQATSCPRRWSSSTGVHYHGWGICLFRQRSLSHRQNHQQLMAPRTELPCLPSVLKTQCTLLPGLWSHRGPFFLRPNVRPSPMGHFPWKVKSILRKDQRCRLLREIRHLRGPRRR